MRPNEIKHQILILLYVVAVFGITGCGGKEERLKSHLEKSKAYYAQTDYAKAGVEVRNALQIDPKNAEGYYVAGLIEEQQQNIQKAFGNYAKAVELQPGRLDAKAKLGNFYLLSGNIAKAEQEASEILAVSPRDAGGRTLKAAVMAAKGDVPGAIEEAKQVLASDATRSEAVSLLAGLYSAQKDDKAALEILEIGIKADPSNIPLRLVHATIATRLNNVEKAEQEYKEIIAIAPQKLEYRVALATFYSLSSQLDKAEAVLRSAIDADKEDEQRYSLLIDFLAARRGAEQAERELQAAIKRIPPAYNLQLRLASLYRAMGKSESAQQLYQSIIDANPTGAYGVRARIQLATIQMASGKIAETEKLVSDVLKENPKDNQGLLLRAEASMAKGDAQSAITDLRAVLKDQPDSPEIVTLLAKAHVMNNEPELAKDAIGQAIARYPADEQLRLVMADYLFSIKDYDGALKEAGNALQINPNNLRALEAKANVLAAKKKWADAEATVKTLKAAAPDAPLGYYRLGQIYLAEKKTDKALIEFEAALKKAPQTIEPLSAVVNVLASQGKTEKALQRVNQIIQDQPDNFLLYLLSGEIQVSQKQFKEAEQSFRKAIELSPKSPAGYLNLSNLYLAQDERQPAILSLQQGLTLAPDNSSLARALAEAYQRNGEFEKAIIEYEKILKEGRFDELATNNLAFLLAETKGDKQNLDRALLLAKHFENSPNAGFVDTLGWVYFKLGDYAHSVPLLQKAVAQVPRVAVVQYHLGMALYKQGDLTAAKAHLQKALEAKIDFPGKEEARKILAQS